MTAYKNDLPPADKVEEFRAALDALTGSTANNTANNNGTPDTLASYRELAQAMLEHISGISSENSRLHHEATTDVLTGLLNKRGLESAFANQLSLCDRGTSKGGYFIAIDADGLKAINDTYGHEAGNDMLKAIGTCLRESTRKNDAVSRNGGDEFCIIMHDVPAYIGEQRMKNMQEKVANTTITLPNGTERPLSISIGGAPYAKNSDMKAVNEIADAKMYQNKISRKKARGQEVKNTNAASPAHIEAARPANTQAPRGVFSSAKIA